MISKINIGGIKMALSIVINKVSTVFSSIPIGTKVADIAVSGGTAPYTYTLATGNDSFQIVGTEVQTKVVMTISNLASFSVTVSDSSTPIDTTTSNVDTPNIQAAIQSTFNKSNMIYKIVDDVDLGNGVLIIPTGSTLDFQGGSFNNGTIKLNSANIKAAPVRIFNNIKFTSIDKNNKAFVEWFNAKGDSVTDDSKAFQDTINSFSNIILLDKTYIVKEVYLKNYTNIVSPSKHTKLLHTGDVVSDYINQHYNCQSIFRTKDNIRIKLSGIYFEGNTYLNGIYFDSDGNNTMPGDADCIIEDCKFQGLNVPIFLQGPYRGCHITRCQSNDSNGKYAFFINGTDNVVEDCISGGARYGGIYLNVNNKIIGSKVFCSNYNLAQNYELVNKVIDKYYNTTPLLYSAVVIQRKCIISGLEIQQAGGNGLYVIGDSNIVQALIDSCGWKRSENSTKESANLVLNGNNNQINISSITGSLDSNISHHVYVTNDVVTNNYVNLIGVNLTSYPKVKLSNRISFSTFIVNGLHFEGVNTFDKSMLGKIVYGEAPSASTIIKNQLGIKFNNVSANSKVEYKIPISLNAYSYIEVKTPIVILKNTESDIEQRSIYNILGLTYNVSILDTSGNLVKSLISGNISSGYNLIDFAGYSGLTATKEYIISISITNTSSEVLRVNIDTPYIIMCGPAGASIPLLSNVDSKLNNPNDLITTTKGLQYVKDTTNTGVDKVFQSNSIIADTTLTGSNYRFIKVADVNIKDLERYKLMVEDESSFIFIYNESSLEVEGYNYVRDVNAQVEFYIKEKTGYYKDLLIKLKANYVKFQIIRSIVGNSITTYAKNTTPTDLSSYTLLPFKMIKTVFKWSEDNKIQISNDGGTTWEDLSPKFADNIHIKGYYSTVSELPSGASDGDIYMVGPAAGTNAYNMYVKTSSGWVDNGSFTSIQAGVVQELGDSTTEVVSQKVVSDSVNSINNTLGYMNGSIPFNRTEYGYINNIGVLTSASSGSNYLMKITDISNIIDISIKAKAESTAYNIISWYDSNDNYLEGVSYSTNSIYFTSKKPSTASYCYLFNRIALEANPEVIINSGVAGLSKNNHNDISDLSFKYTDITKLYNISWSTGSGIDNTGKIVEGGSYINRAVSGLFNVSPESIIKVLSNRLYFSVWDYTNPESPTLLGTKSKEFIISKYSNIRIELRSINDLYDISSYVNWLKVIKPNGLKIIKGQDVINVNSYGIYGDGVTDNTALINTLISNLESGTTLYFPRGIYIISNTININRYIKILGEGASTHKLDGYSKGYEDLIQQGTIFSLKSSANNITMFKVSGWFAGVSQTPPVEFNNLVIMGNAAYYNINSKDNQGSVTAGHYIDEDIVHTGINGIDLTGGSNTLVINCSIFGMSGYGILTSSFANIRDVICRSCTIGFKITTDVNVQGCNSLLCGKGMVITKHGNSIINFRAERCREYGIQLIADVTPEYPMNNLNLLDGIWIEACDYAGIMIKGSNRLMLNGQVQRCGGYYADMTLEQIITAAGNNSYLDKCSNIYSTNIYNNIITAHSNIVGWKDGDSDHNICPYYGMVNENAMYNSKITVISSKIQAIYNNAFYQKDGDSTTNKIRNSALDINNTLIKYDINNTAHEIY